MKFDVFVSENKCGDFLPENGRLQHFWYNSRYFEALNFLDVERCAYGISSMNFLWKIHCLKDEPFVEFEIRLTLNDCILKTELIPLGALDALAQGASFYAEKINLASKLRELNQKWSWSRPFSGKKSPHIFSDTNP